MSVTDRISALTPEQRALFERLRQQQKPKAPAVPPPPPIVRRGPSRPSRPDTTWPLSFDQERLWFLYMLNPQDTAYNIDTANRIRGALDFAALNGAFQEIARRHEIWRTAFPAVDGRPVQVVLPEIRLPSRMVDLRALPEDRRLPAAFELMVQETRIPFRLETGPLVKALLLRLEDEDCICQLTVHHIVTDWVTFQLFWKELGILYESYLAGRPSPLPAPAVQFADYTVWQRAWMRDEVEKHYLRYWVDRLRDAPLSLDLPTDRPRPPVQTSHGDRAAVRVERAAELKSLARREGMTPFMSVLAVYQVLLARQSGQDKVIVGSPNANRNRLEIEETFGFFLTQLPFCVDLSGDPTLREALRRVRETALGAYTHQDLPFGKLVEALQPERDLSRAPIIQVVLLLLDGAVLSPRLAGLELAPVDIHDDNARFDVMFAMWDHPDLIHGWYEYNRDLWDHTTVERLVEGFGLVIEELLADPERRVSELSLLSPAARQQALLEWNDTTEGVGAPVPWLVAARAAERPDAPAVIGEETELTYAELEQRAGRIALQLRQMGVRRGDRVGVCLQRKPDLPAALLGVWRAGAAYLPLDPGHPADRLRLVLADAGAVALVADEHALAALAEAGAPLDLPVLRLPLGADRCDPTDHRTDRTDPTDLAYVIYTSGSTGRPKGVEVTHGALANFFQAMASLHGIGPGDAWLAVTTIAFDIAALEVFLPLISGGRVLLASRETAGDARLLAAALDERGATALQATPATWQQLVDTGWKGRPGLLRICGGEALGRDLADRLSEMDGEALWNHYGPTETTIWSAVQRVGDGWRRGATEPVGRPIANTRVYVLGAGLHPVPLGAVGEVFLGGAGVARGYLGQPALTAERFLPDPLSGAPGDRFYRTGDLGRWLADGRLEFLGRTDHQVKLRGFRIELGEIEAALRRHPAVASAAVVLQQHAGDLRLTACVVAADPAAPPDPADLRASLRADLPDYMIPTAWALLPGLPLSPSGKVDRRALARVEPEVQAGSGAAPRGAVEELLAQIWTRVLGVERVGAADDFFALGGQSLLATRLTFFVRDNFGVDLPVRAVFQATTVAAQAELISSALAGGSIQSQGAGPIRLLPRSQRPAGEPLRAAALLRPGAPLVPRPPAAGEPGLQPGRCAAARRPARHRRAGYGLRPPRRAA